jgi:hypothetical protein
LQTQTQHRSRFVQHRQLQLGSLGPWAGLIEGYSLAGSAARQLLLSMKQQWLVPGAVYGAGAAVVVGLVSLAIAQVLRR